MLLLDVVFSWQPGKLLYGLKTLPIFWDFAVSKHSLSLNKYNFNSYEFLEVMFLHFCIPQENSKTYVSIGFRQPYLCPSNRHQHGDSIQRFINLGKCFFEYLAYGISHRPDSWQGFLNLTSFISQFLVDFLYWMVCIFILDGMTMKQRIII